MSKRRREKVDKCWADVESGSEPDEDDDEEENPANQRRIILNFCRQLYQVIAHYTHQSSWREHSLPHMAPLFVNSGVVPVHKLCTQLPPSTVCEFIHIHRQFDTIDEEACKNRKCLFEP